MLINISFVSFVYNIKTSFSAYWETEEGPIVLERKSLYFDFFFLSFILS